MNGTNPYVSASSPLTLPMRSCCPLFSGGEEAGPPSRDGLEGRDEHYRPHTRTHWGRNKKTPEIHCASRPPFSRISVGACARCPEPWPSGHGPTAAGRTSTADRDFGEFDRVAVAYILAACPIAVTRSHSAREVAMIIIASIIRSYRFPVNHGT